MLHPFPKFNAESFFYFFPDCSKFFTFLKPSVVNCKYDMEI